MDEMDFKSIRKGLRKGNHMFAREIIEKAGEFIEHEYSCSGQMYSETDLFDLGQGFITGYSAEIDGDYNENEFLLEKDVEQNPMLRRICDTYGLIAPDHVLYRASEFMDTVLSYSRGYAAYVDSESAEILSLIESSAYFSTAGFIEGMLRAKKDIEDGVVDGFSRELSNKELSYLSSTCIQDMLNSNQDISLRLYALCDISEEDANEDGEIPYNEKLFSIINAAHRCSVSFASSFCSSKSGISTVPGDIAQNRTFAYSLGWFNGLLKTAFNDIDETPDIDVDGEAEETDIVRMIRSILAMTKADQVSLSKATIDIIDEDGKTEQKDIEDVFDNLLSIVEYADSSKRKTGYSLSQIEKALMYVLLEFTLYDEYDFGDIVPEGEDSYWLFLGIGCLDGVKYAEDEGILATEQQMENDKMLMEKLIETYHDDA